MQGLSIFSWVIMDVVLSILLFVFPFPNVIRFPWFKRRILPWTSKENIVSHGGHSQHHHDASISQQITAVIRRTLKGINLGLGQSINHNLSEVYFKFEVVFVTLIACLLLPSAQAFHIGDRWSRVLQSGLPHLYCKISKLLGFIHWISFTCTV